MIAGPAIPDYGVPSRIGAVEKLIRQDFVVDAIDRNVPFAAFKIWIVDCVGVAMIAA